MQAINDMGKVDQASARGCSVKLFVFHARLVLKVQFARVSDAEGESLPRKFLVQGYGPVKDYRDLADFAVLV